KDGSLTQRFFGAHTYRRTVFYEDWTGQEIVRVLMDQVNQRKIKIIDNVYIIELLLETDGNDDANRESNLMELIYQKRKWKLDLLHIILWVE
ncbi:MAG: FAD-binding protein, partial [Nitrososphaeraceae archaeon]